MTNLNKSLKRFKDLDIHDNSDHEDEHLHDNKGKLEALNTRLTSHVQECGNDAEKGLPGFDNSINVSETMKANRKKDKE